MGSLSINREIKFRISDDLFVFITLYKVPRFGRILSAPTKFNKTVQFPQTLRVTL
jgi:hypothetical protein